MADQAIEAVTFTVEVELVPGEPLSQAMDRWLLAFNSAREQRQCRVDVTEPYPSPFTPLVPSYPGQLEDIAAEMDRPRPRQVPPHTVGGPASGFGP